MPDAEAEDHDEQPVGRGDRDGVECHGHQQEREGPEGAQRHEIGECEHEQDDPRKGSVDTCEEVGPLSRRTADVDAQTGRKVGSGKEPGVNLVHEQLGGFLAEVVPPDDDHLAVPAGGVDVGRSGADGNERDLRIVQGPVREPAAWRPRWPVRPPCPARRATSRTTSIRVITPGPIRLRSMARARADWMLLRDSHDRDPGVSSSQRAGVAAATSMTAEQTNTTTGRRMFSVRVVALVAHSSFVWLTASHTLRFSSSFRALSLSH